MIANILIVDDDKHVIQHVSELIKSYGDIPRYTLEPEYLFQVLEAIPVDLILLDVNMPGIDGVSLLKQLKEHSEYQHIPVIMLTGDENDLLLEQCFEQGASDFINKPVKKIILHSRIKAALATKSSMEQLKSALHEKEILLKEIHHRVKNNLQIIASLFMLQAGSTQEEQVRILLKESQNRVESMALIHEKLYQSKNLADIDARDYIQELTTDIFQTYEECSGRVNLVLDIEQFVLDIDIAVPCALIINELVSNALKYAFPEQSGVLKVSLKKINDTQGQLRVQDNGIGLPKELDIEKTRSLGLRLVRILSKQINGSVEPRQDQGTELIITFSLK